MITVHHLRQSQSERIVWLCEELGLEYDLKLYDRRSDNRMAPDAYKSLHPMGIAPVISDGDMVLSESGAICEYLDRKYGGGRLSPGPDHPDFAGHLFWLHFANGTVMTNFMMGLVLSLGAVTEGLAAGFVKERIDRAWEMIETRLGETAFFGGAQLTTADIMNGYALTTGRRMRGLSIDDKPNLKAYLQRIGERPAYARAMAKCEPGVEPYLS